MTTSDRAKELIGEASHGYFYGGAGDELTLVENEEQWRRLKFSPKNLVDVSNIDTSITILGKERAHPLVIAPMAYQKHAHEEGELGTARAAARTNSVMTLSTQSTTPLEAVAAEKDVADQWFQLYIFRDRELSFKLVQQAKNIGYEALVVTVDFPVGGFRERDKRNGFSVQYPVAVNPGGKPLTPAQLHHLHDPSITWDDIARLIERADMPVILKGILRADEAARAFDVGASGIVVSNHGGRQLDTTPGTVEVLPEIVEAVGLRGDILIDGGVRRGWDISKALALGADGVMVGRPVLWGLADGGAAGATAVLEKYLREFENSLALLGVPNARDLTRDSLRS